MAKKKEKKLSYGFTQGKEAPYWWEFIAWILALGETPLSATSDSITGLERQQALIWVRWLKRKQRKLKRDEQRMKKAKE